VLGSGSHAIESPGGATGWLHRHRFRIVLWVAVVEGVAAWATRGLHITTIVIVGAIALVSLLLYRVTEERTRSALLHQLAWLLAASQLGATILVAAGYAVIGALIVLLVIFALVALGLLLLEHR
jgi:asparagine N-glycosylation enzyme membrane subunit Stt3